MQYIVIRYNLGLQVHNCLAHNFHLFTDSKSQVRLHQILKEEMTSAYSLPRAQFKPWPARFCCQLQLHLGRYKRNHHRRSRSWRRHQSKQCYWRKMIDFVNCLDRMLAFQPTRRSAARSRCPVWSAPNGWAKSRNAAHSSSPEFRCCWCNVLSALSTDFGV